MALTAICLAWLILTLAVCVSFVCLSVDILPQFLKNVYLYGKLRARTEKKSLLQFADVPKRWFLHFYIIGVICNSSSLFMLMEVWSTHLPQSTDDLLQVFHIGQPGSGVPSPVLPVLLVLLCEQFQICRRLYESYCVSIFSDSKISMVHYFTGVILYSTFGVSLLTELLSREKMPVDVNWELSLCQSLGIVLYVWASWKQHTASHLLAGLRKNHTGHVVSTCHHIPSGDLFELVSCPHYLTEILIYLSFCLIERFRNPVLLSVTCFVAANQIIAGYLTHKWYRQTFPRYPKARKAVLPYLL